MHLVDMRGLWGDCGLADRSETVQNALVCAPDKSGRLRVQMSCLSQIASNLCSVLSQREGERKLADRSREGGSGSAGERKRRGGGLGDVG